MKRSRVFSQTYSAESKAEVQKEEPKPHDNDFVSRRLLHHHNFRQA